MDENYCLIIIGEGDIPSDFPKFELKEFLSLKSKIDSNFELNEFERKRFEELKIKIKNWKRNFRNDEYYHTLFDLTNLIFNKFKIKTFFAFLDYCEPDLQTSIENAINYNYKKIYLFSTKLILKKIELLKIQDEINLIKMKYKDLEIVNLVELNLNDISEFILKNLKIKEVK
ncbi:MAG: hypothetical protein N3D74_01460 [Caldisericia bacterium]|nr:hypothetical protein [Caldisericia bacterium]